MTSSANARKKTLLLASPDQNAGQNGNIHIGNKSFETVEHFKYLGIKIPFMKKLRAD
jgi:hypothetical protein